MHKDLSPPTLSCILKEGNLAAHNIFSLFEEHSRRCICDLVPLKYHFNNWIIYNFWHRVLLPQPPEFWDCRHVPSHPDSWLSQSIDFIFWTHCVFFYCPPAKQLNTSAWVVYIFCHLNTVAIKTQYIHLEVLLRGTHLRSVNNLNCSGCYMVTLGKDLH